MTRTARPMTSLRCAACCQRRHLQHHRCRSRRTHLHHRARSTNRAFALCLFLMRTSELSMFGSPIAGRFASLTERHPPRTSLPLLNVLTVLLLFLYLARTQG
jgi:heme/copper-type cytochrome/quinol oxidase subunit 3